MEEWRDIAGYEGFYQVSSEGRVRSIVRMLQSAIDAGIRKEKQILAFGSNKQGRLQVVLCKHAITKRVQVHTLVLEAFVGPKPLGMECLHDDNDYTNNWVGNLKWGTHTENMRDKERHGTQTRGESHARAKLTDDDIRNIRKDPRTSRVIGAAYAVSQVAIVFIKNRKTWKHVA